MGAKLSVNAIKGRKRPALRDRCPQCCGPTLASPGRMRVADDGTEVRCAYRCRSCGHVWAAGWRADAFSPQELAAIVAQGAVLAGVR